MATLQFVGVYIKNDLSLLVNLVCGKNWCILELFKVNTDSVFIVIDDKKGNLSDK